MATTTHAAQSYQGRRFHISRKNGQVDKAGEPYFFEYVKEVPANPGKRLFETRTGGEEPRSYELFKAISGQLFWLKLEEQKFAADKVEKHLIVILKDGAEEYKISLGKPEERYAMDFMKRIIHANFEPTAFLSLSPFAITDKDGRTNMGVSVYSGPNKLTGAKDDAHLKGIPQPQTFENPKTEKVEYNWKPVSNWLLEQIQAFIIPAIQSDPFITPKSESPAPANDPTFPTEEPAVMPESDDLPF